MKSTYWVLILLILSCYGAKQYISDDDLDKVFEMSQDENEERVLQALSRADSDPKRTIIKSKSVDTHRKAARKRKTVKKPKASPPEVTTTTTSALPSSLVNVNTTSAKVKVSTPSSTTPWVEQYISLCPKDVLLPVPRDYINDSFNLIHLAWVVPHYQEALDLLNADELPSDQPSHVQDATELLFCHIHQRYVLSPRGLETIRRRMIRKTSVDPIFGRCPNVNCRMPLLPYGQIKARRYCGKCKQVYYHESKVRGIAWGTSFCHLFLVMYGEALFGPWLQSQTIRTVEPRVCGFRLHSSVI